MRRVLDRLVSLDTWLLAQVVQPIMDKLELAPLETARFLLIGAIIARIIASYCQLNVLGTLTWLLFLGDAYRTLPLQRTASRTPVGFSRRIFLLVTHAAIVPSLDANLPGDDAFLVMLLLTTGAFYAIAGTNGTKRRVETRSLRTAWS